MEDLSVSSLFSVKDLRVVITGGGTGMGSAMARSLAQNGAIVFVLGRRPEPLEETASTATQSGFAGSITPIPCDVTSKDSLKAAVEKVKETTSFLDVVIASSGAGGPALPFPHAPAGPSLDALCDALWEPPMEDFTAAYHTNVTACLYTAVAFLPLLNAANTDEIRGKDNTRPRPQIIPISSVASYSKGTASGYAYNSSKAALNQLFKQLGNLLVPYDIRVNILCPGIYLTPMTDGGALTEFAKNGNPIADGAYPREVVPATRIGGDRDIAGAAVWLCSSSGGYMNGAVIVTDGGALSIRPSSY